MSTAEARCPATQLPPGVVTGPSRPKVAYIVSRFPRLTETFVVAEMAAALRAGADVDLYPLHRERAAIVQPGARALRDRVHHHRLLGPAVARSQVLTVASQPRTYFEALWSVLRHNWGSRRLLTGALVSFPLAVHLARQFRSDGVEHVHAHFATHPAAVAYVVHRLTGIPFSFTAHGSDLHRDRHMLAEKVRLARFVVTVSDFNREVILRECRAAAPERVVILHCGVDRRHFPARGPVSRQASDPLHVLCIGTLHEVKGQTHLVDACSWARAGGTDVRLALVGDGPDRPALEARIRSLGMEEHVRLTGSLTQPQVLTELQAADVVAVPSVPSADGRREGLPVVILEAMTVGVPVLASRLSGIPEVVVDNVTGLLVEPGNVAEMATALTRLAGSPRLASRLTAEAAEEVARRFDLEESARLLVARFSGSDQ